MVAGLLGLGSTWTTNNAHAADQDAPVIIWQQVVIPPAVIAEGPSAGTGYMEQTTNWLIANLPEFQHQKQIFPVAQGLKEMRHGAQICSNFLYETSSRYDFLTFSDPLMYLQPVQLFIAPEKFSMLRYAMIDGEVDLALMTMQQKLSIGMPIGFRFEDELIPGFAEFIKSRMTQSAGTTEKVFGLYEANRIDGFISYQTNVNYFREHNQLARDFVAVPIAGVAAQPLPVSCSGDKALVKRIIDAINVLLSDPANTQQLVGFYSRWLNAGS
jgi:uncharacterized protein (TIGR02285 family)